MIPFFRKLRKKMADDNRPLKYIRYAIGEIILVVIGILIALSINNWNEEKKNNIIVNSVFKQIHSELSDNIKRADELALMYNEKDSLIHLIMNKKLDYKDFKRGFDGAISSYDVMTIKDHGFKNLILNVNNIPSNFNPLLADLKELFVTNKEEIDWSNDAIEKVTLDYLEWLKLNTSWYRNGYFDSEGKLTDEQINFYFSDNSNFQNWVYDYYNYGIENHYRYILSFRSQALKIYRELTKKLNLNKNETDSFSISLTDEEYQQVLGSYTSLTDTDTLKIISRNNTIYFKIKNRGEEEVFFINKTFFTILNRVGGFRTFNLDENKNVTGFTVRYGNNNYEWKKLY